jgi:alkylation response protein AidB-like acyl-CoA dehydrogenase
MHISSTNVSEHLLTTAQAMMPRIQSVAEDIEQQRSLPAALTKELAEAGFFIMGVARAIGGPEADPITATRVIEILSMADGATGWVTMIAATASFWTTAFLADEVACQLFAPATEVIIVGGTIPKGRAVKTAGGYRLSGQWPFASGCQQATWLASSAWLFENDMPLLDAQGQPAWAVFLTPATTCRILDTWHVTGLRGTGSHDYIIEDAFVPAHYSFPHPTQASSPRPERLYACIGVGVVVAGMAAVPLGIARAAVEATKHLLHTKQDRHANRSLVEDAEKQRAVAQAEVLVGSARAYLYNTLTQVWAVIQAGETVSMTLRGQLRGACTHAVLASIQAVDTAYTAGGGTTIYARSPLERYFRDVHTAAAHMAVQPATLTDAGRLLLGLEPLSKLL